MSRSPFESFLASQGPKYASKEPLSVSLWSVEMATLFKHIRGEYFYLIHFSAKTQVMIVNFLERRVGKPFRIEYDRQWGFYNRRDYKKSDIWLQVLAAATYWCRAMTSSSKSMPASWQRCPEKVWRTDHMTRPQR